MTDLELKLKDELNDEQFDAAMHMTDPAVVIAGAGSGKTHTLISRIMHLVDSGVDPKRIVMLTFTNAAADEMKYRASQVNDECEKVLATTYHKYCARIIRQYGHLIGIAPDFETLTPKKYQTLIEYVKSSIGDYDSLKNFPSAAKLDGIYSTMINTDWTLEELICETKFAGYEAEIRKLFNEIKAYGLEHGQLNFDDLLVYMNKLLNVPEICESIANTFDYLMVDEFQDTNSLQLSILTKLGAYNKNIVIVGDVSQSIYKFRGAKATNIRSFVNHFSPKVYTLKINYRSSQEILDAANDIMNNNVSSWDYVEMVADNKHGDKPFIKNHVDTNSQVEWIINYITRYSLKNDVDLKDIAIIERKSMSSFKLENELTKAKIPFEKRGGLKFTDYHCIDEMISFLSVIVKSTNKFEWFNVLKLIPGIGNKNAATISDAFNDPDFPAKFSKRKYYSALMDLLNKIEAWRKFSNISDVFSMVVPFYFNLRETNIELSKNMTSSAKFDALEKVKHDRKVVDILIDMASEYDSILEFLEDIALDTVKTDNPNEDRLIITTIHSAKGLEWKLVILLDCLDCHEVDDFEEELRCWYVAMTRAKDNLVLSVPKMAMINGQMTRIRVNPIVVNSLEYFDED